MQFQPTDEHKQKYHMDRPGIDMKLLIWDSILWVYFVLLQLQGITEQQMFLELYLLYPWGAMQAPNDLN